jgi:hypothetical protein
MNFIPPGQYARYSHLLAVDSYRHGRTVTTQNLKSEFLMALKPGTPPLSDHEQH